MRCPSALRFRLRGFTLIELLVVIAIIALLVAILLPSLQKARRQARTVVCLTNIRSLALAAFTYATEYGRYPPSLSNYAVTPGSGGTNFGGLDWLGVGDQFGPYVPGDELDPQTGNPKGFAASPKFGKLWPYVKNEKAYLCPDDKPGESYPNTLLGGGGNGKFSYTMFDMLGVRSTEDIPSREDDTGPPPPRGGPPPSQVLPRRALARVPLFVEEHPSGISSLYNPGGLGHMEGNFNFNTDWVVSRHTPFQLRQGRFPRGTAVSVFLQGTSNMGFADGHGEGIKTNSGFTDSDIIPMPNGLGMKGVPDTAQGLLYYFGIKWDVLKLF
ncbi:MAG TPA: type II secretion system protein [Phycisphaerae bacterium]|jgi:prepilin-type N-terminal cleavage/methylation domain-containing protein/prepilin-type processing-associated H-X9-DG protein